MLQRVRCYVNSSIVRKTAVAVAAIFLSATLLLSLVITALHAHQMQKRIIADKEELSTEIAASVDALFDNLSNPLISLSNQYSVGRLLSEDLEPYQGEWMRMIRDIETSLSKLHLYYDYVVDLAILDTDSKIHFSLTSRLNHNYDFVGSLWFQEALERPGAVKYAPPHGSGHFYTGSEGPSTFSVIYPVARSGKLRGYILCEVDATRISYLFHDSAMGIREGYVLADELGQTIYDYLPDRAPEDLPVVLAKAGVGGGESLRAVRLNGHLYICRRLEKTGWYIISETTLRAVRSSVNTILAVVALIVVGALSLCFLMLRHIMGRLQRPVDSMVARIASYDGAGPVDFSGDGEDFGEIVVIREKFEEMAVKINALIQDVYMAQMHRRDMELEMLVAQINPHFLYNVLQTIHGEAVLSGNREIEDMISSLGEMLRYTVERTSETSTVAQELQYLNNYLGFYARRFPKLFTYTVQCQEGLEHCRILKYLLQPVVENSIRHGFRDRKEGGVLRIAIRREGSLLRFEITDNGYGISEERLAEIRRDMHLALRGPGVGIANTDARIKLKYGPQYGIDLESNLGAYTKTVITILENLPGGEGKAGA